MVVAVDRIFTGSTQLDGGTLVDIVRALCQVQFLLQAGADQEHKTDEMHTAPMEASMDSRVEVARLLFNSGVQVNMPADSFKSPIYMFLLEMGANIEKINDEGTLPFGSELGGL